MPTSGSPPARSLGHGSRSPGTPAAHLAGVWLAECCERAWAVTSSGTRQLLGEKATAKVPASCTPLRFPTKPSCTFWGPPGALTVHDVCGTDLDSRCWRADCTRVSDLPPLSPLLRMTPEVIGGSERAPWSSHGAAAGGFPRHWLSLRVKICAAGLLGLAGSLGKGHSSECLECDV